MTAAVHHRSYGRPSSTKNDRFSSSRYSGFHPNTQSSGTSWNSVRWVRPTPGSMNRHSNTTEKFTPRQTTTAYTPSRGHYKREPPPSYDNAADNTGRQYWRNFPSENRLEKTERITSLKNFRLSQPTFYNKFPTETYGSSSRRGSINSLQDKNFVLQDAVSALRATADSLSTGNLGRVEENFRSRTGSRRSSIVVGDTGQQNFPATSRRGSVSWSGDREQLQQDFPRNRTASSSTNYLSPATSHYPILSKSWPPTRSLSENSRDPSSRLESRRSSGSLSQTYGSAYYLSGLRKNSVSRSAPMGSSGSYGGLPTGYRSRNSLLNFPTNNTTKWGFPQSSSVGSYRSSHEQSTKPSTFASINSSAYRRGSGAFSNRSYLPTYQLNTSNSFTTTSVPTYSQDIKSGNNKATPLETEKLTNFSSRNKTESEGYDSSSSAGNTQTFRNSGRSKNYRKRNSSKKARRKDSDPYTDVNNAPSLTEVATKVKVSSNDRNQSSSEEDSHSKGLFEYRMNQRRKRLLRSKAMVKSEEFSNPPHRASDSKLAGFTVEKVYLQPSLKSQNSRPTEGIMTTSSPAVFSFQPIDERVLLPLENMEIQNTGNSLSAEIPPTGEMPKMNKVQQSLIEEESIQNQGEMEVDISESSDTLVPEVEERHKISPKTCALPFQATCDNPAAFPQLLHQTIDFSGFEEFSPSILTSSVQKKTAKSVGGAEITDAAVSNEEGRPVGYHQTSAEAENKDQTRKDVDSCSNFELRQQKLLKENHRKEIEAAAVSESAAGSFSILPSFQRTDSAGPRFAGAKRIVLLHSAPNETTVFEKSSSISDLIKDRKIETQNLNFKPLTAETKDFSIVLPSLPKTLTSSGFGPELSLNLDEKFSAKPNLKPGSSFVRRKKDASYSLPTVEKEVNELLTLGEELRASQQSLSKSAATDSERESGFKTPEISDAPKPSKAIFLHYFTPPPQQEASGKDREEDNGSGNTTPTQQRKGSVESLASTFMTAESGSMNNLTFALTAVPQPFRGSSENVSKRYGHVDSGLDHWKEDSPLARMFTTSMAPLQRTASATSNDSWVSAASGRSSALQNAAKKVDEMLRIARRKHEENKTKFRYGVDHLDQIYEDIRKEAGIGEKAEEAFLKPFPSTSTRKIIRKETAAEGAEKTQQLIPKPYSSTRDRIQKIEAAESGSSRLVPRPREWIPPRPPQLYSQETEEIWKPLAKGRKQDFTKRWLEGDLHSLAAYPEPKPDLLQFGPTEADLLSVGSASAEIVAITNKDALVVHKVPDLVPQKHRAVIKPSPVQYASFQDVSQPQPPHRKDSLSSLDSARLKVGKGLNVHPSADERLLDIKANLGHVKRKAEFFGRLNDSGSERSFHSPAFYYNLHTRKPPVNGKHVPVQMKRSYESPLKQQPFVPADEEKRTKFMRGGVREFPVVLPYAESTRSLPVIPTTGAAGARLLEWSKAKTNRKPQKPLEPTIPSCSSTVTGVEPVENSKARQHQTTTGRNVDALQMVDHLVAELELNTEEVELSSRAFPTTGIPEHGVDFNALPEDPAIPLCEQKFPKVYGVFGQKQQSKHKRVHLYEDFNEAQKLLSEVSKMDFGNRNALHEEGFLAKRDKTKTDDLSSKISKENAQNAVGGDIKNGYRSPFRVINAEKLGESKVSNMKTIFEPIAEKWELSQPEKLPVVTAQPPGKGTIPAPIPFRPHELPAPVLKPQQPPNVDTMVTRLRRNSPNPSSVRAFQHIQTKSTTELIPTGVLVSAPSLAKPHSFTSINVSDMDMSQPKSDRNLSGPAENQSRFARKKDSKDDEDYDNIFLQRNGRNRAYIVGAGKSQSSTSLRHPGPIKINSMTLGEEDTVPTKTDRSTSRTNNPFRNLFRRFKTQQGQDDNKCSMETSNAESPKQQSSLSLNESVDSAQAQLHTFHKSNSLGESRWSDSSSLSIANEPPELKQTQPKMSKPKSGRKFWQPWKKQARV